MIFVRNMACCKRNSSNCCESKCKDRHGLKIFETKIQLKVNNNEFALYADFFMQLYIFKINTCISAVMIHVPTIHVFACPYILGKLPLAPFDGFSWRAGRNHL